MQSTMMDYPLALPTILERAGQLFPEREIVSRRPDKSLHRYTYADLVRRAKRLGLALRELGVEEGDRVGTLAWTNYQHLEAYFGIPCMGGVLHTLNLRLHPTDLAYIVQHAGDRVILVDDVLLPLLGHFRDAVDVEHIVVMSQTGDDSAAREAGALDYETLLAQVDEDDHDYPELDERQAAAMCYTSGTTGRPKGVVYSHRAIVLHSFALAMADACGMAEADCVLSVVPMFHVNAWGMPFAAPMVGAKQVLPGPHLDPASLLELYESERVTVTSGVPTIWLGILEELDRNPDSYDLTALRMITVGGSAAPRAMIEAFETRHGLNMVQGWGMTETTPVGTLSRLALRYRDADADTRFDVKARAGRPLPFVEIRARGDDGIVPWDGETMGELEVRGPWVTGGYHDNPEGDAFFTDDGWFRTGDICVIHPDGYMEITDRAKDLVKSGGEWISSIALENALMGHPAVAEAAVIPVAHPKWQERPLAVVVLRDGAEVAPDELRAHLEPHFASWWLPDAFEFVDEIPKTSAGKFQKSELRERFANYRLPDAAPEAAGDSPASGSSGADAGS